MILNENHLQVNGNVSRLLTLDDAGVSAYDSASLPQHAFVAAYALSGDFNKSKISPDQFRNRRA